MRSYPALFVLALAASICLGATSILADCSDHEMTAVFVVDEVYPGLEMSISTLEMSPVTDITNPSGDEMLNSVMEVFQGGTFSPQDCQGHYCFFYWPPMDSGGAAFVDDRTGDVLFAGSIIWSGQGDVLVPETSSNEWSFPDETLAPEPQQVDVYPNHDYWSEEETEEEITARVLTHLRQTDVLKSFAGCEPYSVMSYLYLPTVGVVDPMLAKSVIIVSGHCDSPWNGEPVAVEQTSLSAVKQLFR